SVMERGDGRLPLAATSLGRIASAICYEGDFPAFVRQIGRGDTDLLVLLVNDWAEVKNLHLRMATFRAIENGVPILRATSSGLSAVIDPYGRILVTTDHFPPEARTMVARIPLTRVPTVYARVGDLFAWACVAWLAASMLWVVARALRLRAARASVEGDADV